MLLKWSERPRVRSFLFQRVLETLQLVEVDRSERIGAGDEVAVV